MEDIINRGKTEFNKIENGKWEFGDMKLEIPNCKLEAWRLETEI